MSTTIQPHIFSDFADMHLRMGKNHKPRRPQVVGCTHQRRYRKQPCNYWLAWPLSVSVSVVTLQSFAFTSSLPSLDNSLSAPPRNGTSTDYSILVPFLLAFSFPMWREIQLLVQSHKNDIDTAIFNHVLSHQDSRVGTQITEQSVCQTAKVCFLLYSRVPRNSEDRVKFEPKR